MEVSVGCPSTGLRRRTISTTPSRSCVSGAERKELMAENMRLKRKSYPGRFIGWVLAEKLWALAPSRVMPLSPETEQ